MLFFVDVIRALAMALITNSHYTGVYPTDIIANGGLLGDVSFFAVSGFCLSSIKLPFHKWYLKRIFRIYPITWVITVVYILFGAFKVSSLTEIVSSFVYPTKYHFIGSIILLYIPYYIFVKLDNKYKETFKSKVDFTVLALFVVLILQFAVYLFFYDKSYYHIDTVREPMIRFLYFEAMLIGYFIKKNLKLFENRKGKLKWVLLPIFFVLYFASKLIFSKVVALSTVQIVNQYLILILMTCLFTCIASLSSKLEGLPLKIKQLISFLARITLEIYVVQQVLITYLRKLNLAFPLNWFVITVCIIVCAVILHFSIKLPSIIKDRNSKSGRV